MAISPDELAMSIAVSSNVDASAQRTLNSEWVMQLITEEIWRESISQEISRLPNEGKVFARCEFVIPLW